MATITNDMRAEMAVKAAVLGFKAKVMKLAKQEYALITAVIEKAYPKKLRDAMAELDTLATKEFDQTPFVVKKFVNVNVGGQRLDLGQEYYIDHVRSGDFGYEKQSIKVFRFHDNSNRLLDLMADDKLGVKILAHVEAREALNTQISEAIAQVRGALSNIRTDKQCREQWPEMVPILEAVMPEAKVASNLPTLQRSELNAMLNLPPKLPYPPVQNDDTTLAIAA